MPTPQQAQTPQPDFLANAKPVSAPPPASEDFLANATPVGASAKPAPPAQPATTGQTVVSHLKNLIAGPYHALTDAPRNPEEAAVAGTNDSSSFIPRMLGHVGLGAYRAAIEPTVDALREAKTLRSSGGPQSSLLMPSTYDAQKNNVPTAGSKLIDAIPFYGSWARQYEDEVHKSGALPATAGLATDVLAPEAGGMLLRGLKPAARAVAIGDVTRMIRPNATDTAFGKSPAVGLLEQPRGTMAMSKEGLLDRSKGNLQTMGQGLESEVAKAPQTPMNVSGDVVNPFYTALKEAAKNNNEPLLGRLEDTRKGLTNNLFYSPQKGIVDAGPRNLSAMTPLDVLNLKRQVGDNIKWTNQAFDNDLNATQGRVYGGLKDSLNKAVPTLMPMNEKYANLRSGISALERRIPIEARNNAISLPDAVTSAGAAAAGGIPAAGGALAVRKLLGATPIRTAVQTGLYRFGKSSGPSLLPKASLFFAPTREQDQ